MPQGSGEHALKIMIEIDRHFALKQKTLFVNASLPGARSF